MPLYSFVCGCGHTEDFFRPMAKSGDPCPCPKCGLPMNRDVVAEHGTSKNAEAGEYYSDALGVHPSQIAEAKRQFPHHEFLPDGRMIIRNYQHRQRVMKDLGYIEYDKRDLKTQ